MKNSSFFRLMTGAMFLLFLSGIYSCTHVQYNVSAAQIDSLLNANQEVHILLPEGTNIELVESDNKQKGENLSPGSNGNTQAEKNAFNGIRKTFGTEIMNAYGSTTYQCPPYCEIVLKKPL